MQWFSIAVFYVLRLRFKVIRCSPKRIIKWIVNMMGILELSFADFLVIIYILFIFVGYALYTILYHVGVWILTQKLNFLNELKKRVIKMDFFDILGTNNNCGRIIFMVMQFCIAIFHKVIIELRQNLFSNAMVCRLPVALMFKQQLYITNLTNAKCKFFNRYFI